MAKDEFPIDDPDDEMIPANPARRRVAMITGVVFVLLIIVFIVWFTAENPEPTQERPGLFGWVAPAPAGFIG